MKPWPQRVSRTSGETLVLLLVVLAILGGGAWWLFSARQDTTQQARAFAEEFGQRVALEHDAKFLNLHLSPEAQLTYPPSWRDRFFDRLRQLGTPIPPVTVTGKVEFTSYFFEAKGKFRAQVNYPGMPAYVDFTISHPRALWQIDYLNVVWYGDLRWQG